MSESELVPTTDAARQLGISARTIQRYVAQGFIKPDLVLPGRKREYRWDVANLRRQINGLTRD